jgi:hypothetical protein
MNPYIIASIVVLLFVFYYCFKKESFYNLKEENMVERDLYYRPSPVMDTNAISDLVEVLKNIYTAEPKTNGANVTTQQDKYDLLFKDILVNSEKRNIIKFPNPNSYSIDLNLNINNIYKAELIEVYIPAATDNAINIPTFANRLYYAYDSVPCYSVIQAGTYLSPDSIAMELSRQISITLTSAGLCESENFGVTVTYNKNLNRYVFSDNNRCDIETLVIFPINGYVISDDLTVQKSIASYLMLNSPNPYYSGPKNIDFNLGSLYVGTAVPGDYGGYTDVSGNLEYVPLNRDPQFSNCIVSDVVLTNDKLYLSLDKLNGNTCNIIQYQTPGVSLGNVPNVFCQVPNNTCVSSSSVKTLLNQPMMYSSIQFYNPPINRLNTLIVQWYTETGCLVRILNHCFTLRVYYFQKRYAGTDFSIPIP